VRGSYHEREANQQQKETDHQGRRDDQSPKRHRDWARQHRFDRRANSHSYAYIAVEEQGNETTLMLSAITAKTKPIALPRTIRAQPLGVVRTSLRNT